MLICKFIKTNPYNLSVKQPEVFLEPKLVADLLGVERQGHALHSSEALVLGYLAAFLEQGCCKALALVVSP